MRYFLATIDLLHPAHLSHARNMFSDRPETATSRRQAVRVARELLNGHLICEVRITNERGEPSGEVRRPLTATERKEYLRACLDVRRPGEPYPDYVV